MQDIIPIKAWIIGRRCSYDIEGANPLTRQHLDTIMGNKPLALFSLDFHTVWVNTLALELGGILHGASTPAGSEIVMDNGTATGELREPGAYDFVMNKRPERSESEKLSLIKQGLKLANSYGITSIHNMDDEDKRVDRYTLLEASKELTLANRLSTFYYARFKPYGFTPSCQMAKRNTEQLLAFWQS